MMSSYRSVFDIIGPTMIGPSSSHTAGAVKIGRAARKAFMGRVKEIKVDYYESFAATHAGHGTDYAIIAGVLGLKTDDARVPHAVEIARSKGIKVTFIEHKEPSPINHPNTALVTLSNHVKKVQVGGCSIGGGTIEVRQMEILGQQIKLKGSLPALVCLGNKEQLEMVRERMKNDHVGVVNRKVTRMKENFAEEFDITKDVAQHTIDKLADVCSKVIDL